MHQTSRWLVVAVGLALSQGAWAQNDDSRFKFSGFGTVGFAHSSEDKADVTSDFQTDHGVGASDATSARLDSRLGVQLDVKFTDDFTGVLQAVSEYAVHEDYAPRITMAHVKYRFSPKFSARLGRINAPLYMLSEYQRVGYALPWARPPMEVYNYLLPMDGIEGRYNINAGETIIGIQGFYGRIDSVKASVTAMRGIAVTADHGASSFRVSHIIGRAHYVTSDITALFDTYRNLPIPPLAAVAARLDPRSMDGSFSGIGYSYDPGNWFLRAEAIKADYAPSISGKTTSGYASVGLRHGNWTPSFTVAHVDVRGQEMPGPLDPFGLLNAAVVSNNSNRHSYSAALRWDVHSNMAVKFQAMHVRNHAGAFGSLDNIQPGFVPGRGYNLVSASVDFVF